MALMQPRVLCSHNPGFLRIATFRLSQRPPACDNSDPEGIIPRADVNAAALYEACVLGLAEFQRCAGFTDAIAGPATRLRVAVQPPSTTHERSVAKVRAWLDRNGRSPTNRH